MSGRWLLLSGLLIGVPPRADLQPPADPTQPFGGIGSARRAANGATGGMLQLVRFDRTLGFFQQLLVDHGIGIRQRLPLHTSRLHERGWKCLRSPVETHDVARIEGGGTTRAPLARLHSRHLSIADNSCFNCMSANRAVHKRLGFDRLRYLTLRNHLRPFVTGYDASPGPNDCIKNVKEYRARGRCPGRLHGLLGSMPST